eukprot:gene856-297_t
MPEEKKLIFPPPDMKGVIDKTASFVAKCGPEFEQRVMKEQSNKFTFLQDGNPYRQYFDHMVRKFKAGDTSESKPEVPQAIQDMQAADAAKKKKKQQKMLTMGEEAMKKDIKPPPKDVFSCNQPFITSMDLDIIKLTAQFVARNGQKFLVGLSQREQRNPQFDFLKPTHSLFGFFTALVDAYTKCLLPAKEDLETLKEYIASDEKLLDNAMNRFYYQEKVESERASKAVKDEAEREAMAMIDWHDFVPVETIEFTKEDEELALAPPIDPSTLRHYGEEAVHLDEKEAPKPIVEEGEGEGEVDMDVDEEDMEVEEDEDAAEKAKAEEEAKLEAERKAAEEEKKKLEEEEEKKKATIPLPKEKPMIIKQNYVRQKRVQPTTGKAAMMKCPITGQLVPADEMSKHLKILLLDPQWKDQKNKILEEARKERAFADDVEANLLTFVNKRPDIFGTIEEQIIEAASGAAEAAAREAGADAGPAHSVYNPDAAAARLPPAPPTTIAAPVAASITETGSFANLSGSTTVPAMMNDAGADEQQVKRARIDDGPDAKRLEEEFIASNPEVSIEVACSENVKTLKSLIAPNVPGLLMSKMKLKAADSGTWMTDAMTLAYYQLGNGATIEVHEKARGVISIVLVVGHEGYSKDEIFSKEHNNWAVLIDTSRYWYNYRHVANTLSFYRTVKRMGIPDSNIILMLAEDIACNSRNTLAGTVFNEAKHGVNLYGTNVEVDYRGDDVSTENFLRLFTGRHAPLTPRSKRLMSDENSNVFVFMAGHSGPHFVKVQDWEEVTSPDLADALNQMKVQGRFKELFWVADTCQAATLQDDFYTEGILGLGSSAHKENSYSHHVDYDVGVAIIDRFTFYSLDFFENLSSASEKSIASWTNNFNHAQLHSHPTLRTDLFKRKVSETKLTDFLAGSVDFIFENEFLQVNKKLLDKEDNKCLTATNVADSNKVSGRIPTSSKSSKSRHSPDFENSDSTSQWQTLVIVAVVRTCAVLICMSSGFDFIRAFILVHVSHPRKKKKNCKMSMVYTNLGDATILRLRFGIALFLISICYACFGLAVSLPFVRCTGAYALDETFDYSAIRKDYSVGVFADCLEHGTGVQQDIYFLSSKTKQVQIVIQLKTNSHESKLDFIPIHMVALSIGCLDQETLHLELL